MLYYGKAHNLIKQEQSLRNKLKMSILLTKTIKHPLFIKMIKELPQQILDEFILEGFYNFAKKNVICMSKSATIQLSELIYDFEYDTILVSFTNPTDLNIHCIPKNVYVMDSVLTRRYNLTNQNIQSLVYKYKNKIYLYHKGKVFPLSDYKGSGLSVSKGKINIIDVRCGVDCSKYAMFLEEEKHKWVLIDGKQFKIPKRCDALYTNEKMTNWAVVCKSKKYKNKIFVIYKNHSKFLFDRINNIKLYGDGICYVGYNNRNSAIIINSTIHRRFTQPTIRSQIIVAIYPFDSAGSRWIYTVNNQLIDTEGKIRAYLFYGYYSFITIPDQSVVYYLSASNKGDVGLYRNKKRILSLPIPVGARPLNIRFYITNDNRYILLIIGTYSQPQVTTLVFLLHKTRVKKYRLNISDIGMEFKSTPDGNFLFSSPNSTGNKYCFLVDKLNIRRISLHNCPREVIPQTKKFSIFTDKHDITHIEYDKKLIRRLRLLPSLEDVIWEKDIVIATGATYSYAGGNHLYSYFLLVSLRNFHKNYLILSPKNSTNFYEPFYFERHSERIIFTKDGILSAVPLKEYIDKFLVKIKIFCTLQKKLCAF